MLKVGDKVMCYVDEIEGYRMFIVEDVEECYRYQLVGVDTPTTLNRVLRNDIKSRLFNYYLAEG